jgi:hypothetical protein
LSEVAEGLASGAIDCVATDHAPHAREEKEQPFELAPMGVTGLETAFAALHTELVLPEHGIVLITGPNGYGKSTFLESVAVAPADNPPDNDLPDGDDLAAQVDDAPHIDWGVVHRSHVDLFVNFLDLCDSNPAPDIAHFENNPLSYLCRRQEH